eukprot:CAMPEP_0206260900 /NCGR_PEP_ID=MMETSP0047_2-20121206/27349_1 /ASSEMBLY_ACC=CAM_ASM_000192 /TAXON_ID=195065 /ORGANISM="Chroomonas mesostigmatica_cf, Strain CCMP1168" /LENGTH=97 /DNA_ID=CAMNT_0053688041 /DNA_START=137 /DNA_END=427 /DNA_ORIENTATION=+
MSDDSSDDEGAAGTRLAYDPDLGVHGAPHVDIVTDLSDLNKVCKVYMARNKPVLLKGAAKEWPAASKWKFDYFREGESGGVSLGDISISVSLDGREK